MLIRPATSQDDGAIWRILEPTIRAGETYPLPRDLDESGALAYWHTPGHEVFIAEDGGETLGTYYMRANNRGGGAHVANCGYMTAEAARGRGIARAMCEHSLREAKARGFSAMQFNFVVSRNEAAVHLWQSCGFEIVGRLPEAFDHPRFGLVDALILYHKL